LAILDPFSHPFATETFVCRESSLVNLQHGFPIGMGGIGEFAQFQHRENELSGKQKKKL
jgi:hypothetical protein